MRNSTVAHIERNQNSCCSEVNTFQCMNLGMNQALSSTESPVAMPQGTENATTLRRKPGM